MNLVDDLITRLGEHGMYTLVDAHQDVLARVMCGEGIPNFYAKEIIEAESEGHDHPACFSHEMDFYIN